MHENILHSNDVKVGEVFTPLEWAEWLIKKWEIFDSWIKGASVCDPTAGRGVFALALLRMARSANITITQELLSRLTLIEIKPNYLIYFKDKVRKDFGITYPPQQLLVRDVITDPPNTSYDILVGNPPWANFTELPDKYKEILKPYFVAEGLVPDRRKILLGSSRTDIAALVLKVVLGKLLKKNGVGYFFIPLSLFFGDDAHKGFRNYIANSRNFYVDEVYEFSKTKVFNGIGTAYCAARFLMDQKQKFPVRYFRQSGDNWLEHQAIPLNVHTDQWRVIENDQNVKFKEAIDIHLSPKQKPRQGVNTCGANDIFIFKDQPIDLPNEFIFPLATKDIWRNDKTVPQKWILLPYDKISGKPLSWIEIEQYPTLRKYLLKYREKLEHRKGTLIRSYINKGIWWALLGVGQYSFSPYKVIWEAYGKSSFDPIILQDYEGQVWQANQAMQAFIPCWTLSDAKRICAALKHPNILSLLQQLNGNGKCNWAQPGKIKKILYFDKPKYIQSNAF